MNLETKDNWNRLNFICSICGVEDVYQHPQSSLNFKEGGGEGCWPQDSHPLQNPVYATIDMCCVISIRFPYFSNIFL